jgi:probable rRNA maturation factor
MTVHVAEDGAPRAAFPPARVRRMAERMLRALRLDAMELSVLLTDDATIHALNRDHRRIDRPTDVLAYAQHEDANGRFVPFVPTRGVPLGDVVISLDTARRDAATARIALDAELALLLAHGLLHLLGMDHRTKDEERRMKARTQLLAHLALAPQSQARHDKRSPDRPARTGQIGPRSRRLPRKTR